MHNGLKPSVRGLKGVGFNRALPAAFGFGKGMYPDGVNDLVSIPGLYGKSFASSFAVEFWIKPLGDSALFRFDTNSGNNFGYLITPGGTSVYRHWFGRNGYFDTADFRSGGKDYVVINFYSTQGLADVHFNYSSVGALSIFGVADSNYALGAITGAYVAGYAGNAAYSAFGNSAMDEFRVYNRILSGSEMSANYNAGIGENPQNTIGLSCWYKFEAFENLDFSPLQDNSDIRLGLRDWSGNFHHGLPVNCDTNPTSPNYCLKPF